MNLQELLGADYVEGMSIDAINNALSTKKFADLSTGQYVDKNKYNTEINNLKTALANKDAELQGKLTDAEKEQNEKIAKDNKIQELENLIKQQKIENNKNKSIATVSEAKNLLEIKDDDKDYTAFITNVSNCESESASNISAYFNKIVKDAYNKGKNDAVKDNLGKMGNAKGSASNGSKNESLGSKLGKMAQPKSTFSYWK